MKTTVIRTWLTAMVLLAISPPIAAEPRDFGPDSMRAIEGTYAGRRFIMILWTTDCAPCRRELELISRVSSEHPELPVVLVSSDVVRNDELVLEILSEYGLEDGEVWLFADPSVERLRFAVDPGWFGEVPRAYLYDGKNERIAISGPLAEERLYAWIARIGDIPDSMY